MYFHSSDGLLTINEPVVYMVRYVMVEAGKIHSEGRWMGWDLEIKTFWALKWLQAKRVPFGLKKVEISMVHPFQCSE